MKDWVYFKKFLSMKDSFKTKYKDFVKNHLLMFAFGFLGLLILIGTIIINIFWGGDVFLNVANENTIVKEYMAIYISMLGVIATFYASFVVIFAYDFWKDQKNFDTNVEILKGCDENLFLFKRNLDSTSNTINMIYDTYKKNKQFYTANSLYIEPIKSNNIYFDNFCFHFERYLDLNKIKDKEIYELKYKFYEISKNIIMFNNFFITHDYFYIYERLKDSSFANWCDSAVVPSEPHEKTEREYIIEILYENLIQSYDHARYIEDTNPITGVKVRKVLNYNEYYNLLNCTHKKINEFIKEKMKA
ncbi:hypothetical protein ACT4U2_13410 [Acinetobacter baumannii]